MAHIEMSDFQQLAETVNQKADHVLHKYYNDATFDDLERVFRCNCNRKPKLARMPRERHTAIEQAFIRDMCPELDNNYLIYGVVGRGSKHSQDLVYWKRADKGGGVAYGTIVAARGKEGSPAGMANHFAIKIQSYVQGYDRYSTDLALRAFGSQKKNRFTHKEAFVLSFFKDCERISHVVAAGIHGNYAYIVMNLFSVDLRGNPTLDIPDPHDAPPVENIEGRIEYPAFNGQHCTNGTIPRLDEVQVCKVVTHLLEALMFANDRGVVHLDMSPRNFLIDAGLNAQLIDWDQCRLCIQASDYESRELSTLYGLESMISPELITEINRGIDGGYHAPPRSLQRDYPARHIDVRHDQLWKYACIVFELLHGYAPFADLERLGRDHQVNFRPAHVPTKKHRYTSDEFGVLDEELLIEQRDRRYRRQRRDRVRNGPLQFEEGIIVENGELVDERPTREDSDEGIGTPILSRHTQNLNQDCIDVLEAMFRKDRDTRPTVEELASFPWFQGWYLERKYQFIRPPRYNQAWRRNRPTDLTPRPTDSPPTIEMRKNQVDIQLIAKGIRTAYDDRGAPSTPEAEPLS
ncbi:MAG: hypothetical protein M1835_003557 [Candelina submexicana]|nr:MAG: hypothetical protein M1835_003557 [Candelina submexicana]